MRRVLAGFLIVLVLACACSSGNRDELQPLTDPLQSHAVQMIHNGSGSEEEKINALLEQMTLEEKIGQMTLVEVNSITHKELNKYALGAITSGGDGLPTPNTLEAWKNMIQGTQSASLANRMGIPLFYGVDSTHGFALAYGMTVFPQQAGLGAANDADLVKQIAKATAHEMLAVGANWSYSPLLSVPQDLRWGRTYESFSEDTTRVTSLGAAAVQGLQSPVILGQDQTSQIVLATPKHYIGDGGTAFGSSTQFNFQPYLLDQGDTRMTEEQLRRLFLPPYQAAIDAGALSVMVSFSSWNGTKIHADGYLINDVLKGELGFEGFVVSDWGGMDQIHPNDYYQSMVDGINAGIDMNMVPYDFLQFMDVMTTAVNNGDISEARIDDAVRRILRVKLKTGLFDHPYAQAELLDSVYSLEHQQLAREAVQKSLVLLANQDGLLPLDKDIAKILVAGHSADDMGVQCGGWTSGWQGTLGDAAVGTTLLEGIIQTVSPQTEVIYDRYADFDTMAEIGIVIIGELPYAEGVGDTEDLSLSKEDIETIQKTRAKVQKLLVVLVSGRPLVITEQFALADAWVMAWLPGSQGQGVSDVLFGDVNFSGTLPYTWPRLNPQDTGNAENPPGELTDDDPFFPFGYGLEYQSK